MLTTNSYYNQISRLIEHGKFDRIENCEGLVDREMEERKKKVLEDK